LQTLNALWARKSLWRHAADVRTIVNALGIGTFSVIGRSGSVPQVLTCSLARRMVRWLAAPEVV
jgi:hypothetical protein